MVRGRVVGRAPHSTRKAATWRWRSSSSPSTISSGSANTNKEADVAVPRDTPYGRFNFLVDLGTGNTDGPQAGFQECTEIGMNVDVIEYRNGNDKQNSVRKLTGLT